MKAAEKLLLAVLLVGLIFIIKSKETCHLKSTEVASEVLSEQQTTKIQANPKTLDSSSLPRMDLYNWFMNHNEGRIAWKWLTYFEVYEEVFGPLRDKPGLTIVEIGTRDGGSLDMWKSYFHPTSKIHGIDINPYAIEFADGSTRMFIGSQNNRTFLKEVGDTLGKIDIVIDDASHRHPDQIASFEGLYPYLQDRGVYLIEDVTGVQANEAFWNYFGAHALQVLNKEGSIYSIKCFLNIIVMEKHTRSYPHKAIKKGNIEIKECRFKAC